MQGEQARSKVDKWLVRTEKNLILGPFSTEDVRQMITSGALGYQDEVCGAGSYWIYLHEIEEVKRQLGITVPRQPLPGDEEEVTETDTESVTTEISLQDAAAYGDVDSDIPELSDSVTENTAVLNNRAFRQFRAKKPAQAAMGTASSAPTGVAPHSGVSTGAPAGNTGIPANTVKALDAIVAGESVDDGSSGSVWQKVALWIVLFVVTGLVGAVILYRLNAK